MTVTFPNNNQQKHLVKQTGALEGQLLLAPKLIQVLPVSKYGGGEKSYVSPAPIAMGIKAKFCLQHPWRVL